MVKNFQDVYFEGRNQSTKLGYNSPSFAGVAEAFGIESYIISDERAFKDILRKVKETKKPILIEVLMTYATECRPRLLFGNTIDKQYPPTDVSI
jgi:acetolactate synthase-1/2/3 large subunit